MPIAPPPSKPPIVSTTRRTSWRFWGAVVLLVSFLVLVLGPSFTYPPAAVEDYLEQGRFIVINDGFGDLRVFVREEPVKYEFVETREAVLLIHGVPSSGFLWRKVLPEVSQGTKLRAVSFDLPGMGLSDKPTDRPYTFSYFADVTARVVEALKIDKAHLVLHDISGPFGSEFAIKNPSKVASITYSNTLPNVAEFHQPFPMMFFGWRGFREIMWQLFTNDVFSPLQYLIFKWRLSDNMEYTSMKAYSFLLSFDNGKDTFFKIMKNFNLTKEYRDFLVRGLHKYDSDIPKQLVWSTRDILPKSHGQAEFLHKSFQIEKETWIDAKHFIQEDKPEEFAHAVFEFVNEHKLNRNPSPTIPITKPDPTFVKSVS